MNRAIRLAVFLVLLVLITAGPVLADHNGSHAAACDLTDSVGGGTAGNSPGIVGPGSLGWDVGSGQCNGSFATVTDAGFPGGAIELGLRAEQRRVGQVARVGADDYEVQVGNDTTVPAALNRAWWNFQLSIAYDGDINTLDALNFEIRTDVGPNVPANALVNLVGPGPAPCPANLRDCIDDRNNQPNATSGFGDLYQVSQNPEFAWFAPASDPDANPTGAFDYDAEGAWFLTLTAIEAGETISRSICIHTPNAECSTPVPASDAWSLALLAGLVLVGLSASAWYLRRRTLLA